MGELGLCLKSANSIYAKSVVSQQPKELIQYILSYRSRAGIHTCIFIAPESVFTSLFESTFPRIEA